MSQKRMTRFLALFLSVVMAVGYIPTFAFATEGTETQETTAPADETTAPADETTAPADETTAPADETTAPADETTAPADETTAPADETTPPAETDPADDDPGEEDEEIMPLSDGEFPNSGLSVATNKASTLAAGVTENKYTVYDKNGDQVKMFVATADPSVSTVKMFASYLNMNPTKFGMSKLTEQVAAFDEKAAAGDPYYQGAVVVGINASYYNMTTGQPTGIFVMNGVVGNASESAGYFAVMKDGSVKIGVKGDYASDAGNIQEAIGIYTMLIVNGEICSGLDDTAKYPRQTIGITADGKVVIMSADGNQAPKSAGLTMLEQAQVMQDLGCVWAGHLDGGGSMTYGSKAEGEDTFKIVNNPCDGSERSISNGFIIVSTEAQSNAFSKVKFEVENEYVAPGASIAVEATGVSQSGSAADIPAEVVYSATNGTISDGVYTAGETVGTDTIVATLNGTVVGSVDVHIVIPDAIAFDQAEMVVPYGKTVEIAVTATTNGGLNAVKICENTVEFTFDNEIGTMDGFAFTAAEDPEVTSAVCTVTVVDTEVSASANITLGKGSEVIADFNDGKIGSWKTQQLLDFNYYFPGNKVSVENGALRVEVDYSNSFESGYMCTGLGTSETYVIENGLALGFRIFVPEESEGLRLRMCFYDENNARKTADLLPIGKVSTLEKGAWYYVKADISAYPTVKILEGKVWLEFYICDRDDLANYGYNHLNYDSLNTKLVFYIDDITVDYSSAVDDREAPALSNPTYAHGGVSDAVTLSNGAAIAAANIDFAVSVSDDGVGIDANTVKAYVDGNVVSAAYSNGLITTKATLASGTHHIKFEIADKNGNAAILTRSFTVSGGSKAEPVKLVAHDASLQNVLFGSLYYVDLVAENIENVKSVTAHLDLNNMNKWQLDHMEVTNGFKATYSITTDNNVAKIVITRTGDVALTGEAALVSIPIRVYEMPIKPSDSEGAASPVGSVYTYASFKSVGSKGESWPVSVNVEVDKGTVTYTDGASDFFSGEDVKVMTEAQWWHNDSSTGSDYLQWNGGHDHRAETKQYYAETLTNHVDAVALEDKAATCTEDGYTGRTYCETCNSVVDWGTTIPATDHTYEFVDGVLKCACGELFTGTWTDGKEYVDGIAMEDGWVGDSYYVDGQKLVGIHLVPAPDGSGEFCYDFGTEGVCAGQAKYNGLFLDTEANVYRFAKLGVVSSGWFSIEDEWYYFDPSTNAAAVGTFQYTEDITYEFDETGKLLKGCWVKTLYGWKYYYGPDCYKRGWAEIEGKTYFFENYYRLEGYRLAWESSSPDKTWYNFGEDGALVDEVIPDGFYEDGGNGLSYVVSGKALTGEQVIDGVYYGFNWMGYAQKGMYAGRLYGDDYKAVTGIVEQADGAYYYLNGKPNMAGLIEIDGHYYFAAGDGKLVTGEYYVWQGNGIIPESARVFGENGQMLDGIAERDGKYYYYVMGQPQMAGLIQVDGNYYFAKNSDGELVTGEYYVWQGNGIIPESTREFGNDGKLLDGIVEKDGSYYYYEMGQPKMAGLVCVDGAYYFARGSKGEVVIGQTYYVWKTNGLLPEGNYEFGPDGKMCDGIAEIGGKYYYYVNGKPKMAGLVEVAGSYYFAAGAGEIITDRTYYVWQGNGIIPESNREFGPDGKMLDGIVNKDGVLYYYVMGQPKMAGLIEVDGAYYFAKGSKGEIATSQTCYVWQGNGVIPESDREFGPDGKMLDGIVEKDDSFYYYEMGQPKMAGLIEVDGCYYFAKDADGLLIANQVYYVWQGNGILPEGNYEFGPDGKMLDGFVTRDDGIYYYEDGRIGTVGLNYIDGYYYFVGTDGKLVTNRTYYVWKTNGLTVAMNYTFDELGRIVL